VVGGGNFTITETSLYDVHDMKRKKETAHNFQSILTYELRAFSEGILDSFYENHQWVRWEVTLELKNITEN